MKRNQLHILIFPLLFSTILHAQILNTEVKAKIELSYFEEMVSVTGTAENLDDGMKNLSYTLSVSKKNKHTANTSNNSQNGEFTLNPNEKKILSKGDTFFIPSEKLHGVICLEEGILVESFSPKRQDFIEKN